MVPAIQEKTARPALAPDVTGGRSTPDGLLQPTLIVPLIVLGVLVANALTDGYFRDEFYYLACARRLAWGYVDHPPLSVALLAAVTALFGEPLLVLRVSAAVVASATVWLVGRLARRMGGDRTAETLAMTATAVAPMLLAMGTFYSMNVLELLIWTLTAYVFVEVLERPSTKNWTILGLLLGFGLLNKISVLWLGAGIAAGLAVWRRPLLATRGAWLAGAIAALITAPHVFWQVAHGWPTLEFIRNASAEKMQESHAVSFLLEQVANVHPVTLPVWLGGLAFLLWSPRARAWRPAACLYLVPLIIVLANRTSRSGYLAPAYPLLFAAGGVLLAPMLTTRLRRVGAIGVLSVAGLITLPLAVPLLPTERYVTYASALGFAPSTDEKKDVGRLPQFFADREGWPDFVAAVVAAWNQLPAEERARAAVLAGNYGEAGAIEQLAREHGIRVISGHNNYWLWGFGDRPIETLLVLSRSRERQEQRFRSVTEVGRIACGDCMPYENGLRIFAGRGLKGTMAELWPDLRHFD